MLGKILTSSVEGRHQLKTRLQEGARWAAIVTLVVAVLIPVYAAFRISLTPYAQLGEEHILPTYWAWDTYLRAIENTFVLRQILNSFIFATAVTTLNLLIVIPAAYALSRYDFRGKYAFMFGVLMTQMLAAVTIVPGLFAIVVETGFIDTYIGVIVPLVAINTALSLWLLKGFFDTVDVALEDAARMDGCSRLQIIRQIVMPISIPGILTSAIFVFIASYNAFLIPLILLSDRAVNPVTVGIYAKFGDQPIQYDIIMAMTIMALIPILVVFFYMQKYIVKGLTSGGFKGM